MLSSQSCETTENPILLSYPDFYSDKRGEKIWEYVIELLEQYRQLEVSNAAKEERLTRRKTSSSRWPSGGLGKL